MKKLGIIIFFIALLGFIGFLIEFDVLMMLLTLFIMFISYYVIKNSGNADIQQTPNKSNIITKNKIMTSVPHQEFKNSKETIVTTVVNVSTTEKTDFKTYTFRVTGISKKDNEGVDIQKKIKEFVKGELEYMDKYEGYSNKEILEYGAEVYEADLYGFDEISLVPEPDNPFDPDAIKVVHNEVGHVGYVPKAETKKVKELLGKECKIHWRLLGGKFKYVDYDEYKVKTKTLTYGMEIELIY